LGYLAQQDGRYEEAEAHYLQALKEGDRLAHNNLGTLCVETGRLKEAEKHFRLGADRWDVKARRNLRLFFEEGGTLPGINPPRTSKSIRSSMKSKIQLLTPMASSRKRCGGWLHGHGRWLSTWVAVPGST
jgi:tetratricopeptide (TPR) repeat protein